MLVSHPSPSRRRGVTVVEVALLMSIFLLFLFGVYEYCRYLLVLHVTTNAARDGARWASVRVSQGDTLTSTATTDADFPGKTVYNVPAVTTEVTAQMFGTDKMISGFTVRVFPCDSAALYGNPTGAGTPPANTVVAPKVIPKSPSTAWYDASFTERIAVRATGTYQPVLPNFLWMGNTASIKIAAVVGSEG